MGLGGGGMKGGAISPGNDWAISLAANGLPAIAAAAIANAG